MLIDLLIVLFSLSALMRGREIGLVRQLFSTGGFFGGLFLGAWLQPHIIQYAHTTGSRALITLLTTLGCAMLLLTVAEAAGIALKLRLQGKVWNRPDIWLGAIASAATLLIFVWLSLPTLAGLPYPGLQQALRGSYIVGLLDDRLPPAPNIVSRLSRLIYPNGFPKVFVGSEPAPNINAPLPDLGDLTAAVQKDRASVVKIEGMGCGGVVEGSGFVFADGFVVTNAHVVAGIANPTILDGNGRHQTRVIGFDSDLDVAVLQWNNLAGAPLAINAATAADGTASAVLGYPGGGDFTADAATVMDNFTARGRNIYDQGDTRRAVYSVKATIIPGNSGGPLVNRDGTVIGLVFAQSTEYNQVGYALVMQQVETEINHYEAQNTTVSTGQCAAE